jgi:hypothetical protein
MCVVHKMSKQRGYLTPYLSYYQSNNHKMCVSAMSKHGVI